MDPNLLAALLPLVAAYLRPVGQFAMTGDLLTGTADLAFTPPLSTAEQATYADLQAMAKFGITASLTLAEFQAIKPDLALGKAFLGIASPTNAQAVAAEKAIIRVLGALLRS